MAKAYSICIFSVITSVVGIILAACSFLFTSLSYRSRGALIIFACTFICIGMVSFIIHYKHYLSIKNLVRGQTSVIARWTYAPHTSTTLLHLMQHQKHITLFISVLCLLFIEVFIFIFVNGEDNVLSLVGLFFAILTLCVWIIICRFILIYYEQLVKNESVVLFSKDCIYFMDNIYFLTHGLHILENVDIYHSLENVLVFEYGLDESDHSYAETLIIPIPSDKLQMAQYLKNYYRSILSFEEDE